MCNIRLDRNHLLCRRTQLSQWWHTQGEQKLQIACIVYWYRWISTSRGHGVESADAHLALKNMTKMPATIGACDLNALHAKCVVHMAVNSPLNVVPVCRDTHNQSQIWSLTCTARLAFL